jgi:hypothetical protein
MNDNALSSPDLLVALDATLRIEFPALVLPAGAGPVEAALYALRHLYGAGRSIMRGDVQQALVHAVAVMPQGPEHPGRPARTIEPAPDGGLPRSLMEASKAWDDEFRSLCQALINIGMAPTNPQQKQNDMLVVMKRFMGAHERVAFKMMCLRPPPGAADGDARG